jgi:hypothetical protein
VLFSLLSRARSVTGERARNVVLRVGPTIAGEFDYLTGSPSLPGRTRGVFRPLDSTDSQTSRGVDRAIG